MNSDFSSEATPTNLVSVIKTPAEFELILKVEPVLQSLGYGLRDLEILGASSGIIRVTLESLSATEIGIDDCRKVHEILGPMFDVWDPLPGAYTLEISSPGEKPTLRLARHFEEAVGNRIQFQTQVPIKMPEPLKPRRNWEGVLKKIDTNQGRLEVEDGYGNHELDLSQIKSAVWLRDWSLGGGQKNNAPKGKQRKEKR